MPEMLTKYPDVAIQILKDNGAKCGTGEHQQILTTCPKDRFCSLNSGEICVYGVGNMKTMTQLSTNDFVEMTTGAPSILSSTNLMLLLMIFGLGLLAGTMLCKRKK